MEGQRGGAAHVIHIINKRRQIVASKVCHTFLILLPKECVVELIREFGRGFVKAIELFQGWGKW